MIPPVTVNFMVVFVVAVLSTAIRFLWTGLFGFTEKSNKSVQMYALSFICAAVMAFILTHFLRYAYANTVPKGFIAGFWLWLGFIAPVQLTEVIFSGKKLQLFIINTGYQLASLLIMGAILAVWK